MKENETAQAEIAQVKSIRVGVMSHWNVLQSSQAVTVCPFQK
jgi:hypothetical protein